MKLVVSRSPIYCKAAILAYLEMCSNIIVCVVQNGLPRLACVHSEGEMVGDNVTQWGLVSTARKNSRKIQR